MYASASEVTAAILAAASAADDAVRSAASAAACTSTGMTVRGLGVAAFRVHPTNSINPYMYIIMYINTYI